ncbi:MAG: radical SAM protein [Armatimonadota bacterium]
MKITLIYPGIATTDFNSLGKGFHDAIAVGYGLAYIGAYIKENSAHEVDLIDLRELRNWEHFRSELNKRKSDIVGIYSSTVNYDDVLNCAAIAKEQGKVVVAGGPHATIFPDELLQSGNIDHVVIGEGEKALLGILDNFEVGKNPEKKIVGEKIDNLDELPYPDRDLYNVKKILNSTGIFPYPHRYFGIITSRGCPFNCSFCQPVERKIFGNKIRYRSVDNVIAEVEHVIKKYGINFIMFEDDTFTFRKDWAMRLCSEMERFKIKWGAQSRVDTLDDELAAAMRKAGCRVIFFGFESGSPRILNFLRKGTKPEQAVSAARICKKNNILIFANYMLGIPTETEEDLNLTHDLIEKIHPELHSPTYFSPIPGSDLYTYCKENNLIKVKNYKEFVRNPTCEKIKGIDYPVFKSYLKKMLKFSPSWFEVKYFRETVLERWSGLLKTGRCRTVLSEFFIYTPPFSLFARFISALKVFWRNKFGKK